MLHSCQMVGQHFTLIGLLGSVVGNDDARGGLGFLLEALDDHAIVQRTKFHVVISSGLKIEIK